MAPTPVTSHHSVMTDFDQSVERMLGADMRLVYGLAVPLFMVIGLIVMLALNPTTWLVIAIIILEILALSLIVYGLMNMMSDEEDHDS